MIKETRRPLLAGERPRIERSLKRARGGAFLAPIGRLAGLIALWIFGIVIANTVARVAAPVEGEPPDLTVLRLLQAAATLLVLGPGVPILVRSIRRASARRRANIALYEEILHSSQMPVIEIETTSVVRFIDHLELGDCYLCEVEPRKCLFLVGGPDEEMIKSGAFPTRTFEVVSYGTGDFDTTVRPTSDLIEPDQSLSAKEIHWPDWEHAEIIERSMEECLAELRRAG